MGQRVISKNTLFYGDNLTILREYLADETIDLVYLDPPFNSSRNLKLVLDMLFGAKNFRNEVIWHYRKWAIRQQQFVSNHDVIFFYSKSESKARMFNQLFMERSESTLKRFGKAKIVSGYDEARNRLPSKTEENESEGVPLDDVWDIGRVPPIKQLFPTQKPLALLERIIQASSNPGDVVLDPFCGCGTAVHAAHKLQRIWAGVDITPLATTLIKSRLYDVFKIEAKKDYDLIGEPTTLSDAQHLAMQDRYQFQWWALGLLPARPYGGQGDSKQGKKGADKGIDGIITFQDSYDGIDKRIIVQVKSGKVSSRDLRDLHGTVEREKNAVMGVFITLESPSQKMEIEQMEIGYYHSVTLNRDYPKIQILTIEQLLAGTKLKIPGGMDTTLKHAQAEQVGLIEQNPLL